MLESARLVSIIREVEEKEIISIIEGLVEEGIRWFEISLSDGENGMKCIRTSRKYFEGRDVYIGAGTVKKKEEIDVLSDMGVPYILTPGFDEQIVRYALEKKIEVLPGVLTPSEVQAAVNCGINVSTKAVEIQNEYYCMSYDFFSARYFQLCHYISQIRKAFHCSDKNLLISKRVKRIL